MVKASSTFVNTPEREKILAEIEYFVVKKNITTS